MRGPFGPRGPVGAPWRRLSRRFKPHNRTWQPATAAAAWQCRHLPDPTLCHAPTGNSQVDSEGRKFGKSTGGAIWLSADKLSPYKFYQYLFGVTDADVIRMLRMLTFLPLEEIAEIEASMKRVGFGSGPRPVSPAAPRHLF